MERVLVDVCLIHVFDDIDLSEFNDRLQISTVGYSIFNDGRERDISPLRYSASLDCKVAVGVNLSIRSKGGGQRTQRLCRGNDQRQILDFRCRSLLTPERGPNGWTMSERRKISNK